MERRIRQTLSEVFDAEVGRRATVDHLGGHASLRIYWRVHLPTELEPPRPYPRGETSMMAMVLPEGVDPFESAEGVSEEAQRPQKMPFVDVQNYLADIGMPVPAIDTVDLERGVLLLEDLGDRLFEDAVVDASTDDDVQRLYRQVIDLLVDLQCSVLRDQRERVDETSPCIGFQRSFDRDVLRWELDHYLQWGLVARVGDDAVDAHRHQLQNCFDQLVDELLALPQTLVLRDYQSRNIMWKQTDWILIDFQDALIGPFVYDLVALLRDSYIELPDHLIAPLIDHYVEAGDEAGLPWCDDADSVHRAFHLQTIQRKLKDAGRFINIDRTNDDPSFLDYYEPSIQYVRHALEQLDELNDLAQLLDEIEPAFTN